MRLQDRVRDGYTPTTSLSRHETDILKEFFGSHGKLLIICYDPCGTISFWYTGHQYQYQPLLIFMCYLPPYFQGGKKP